MKKCKKCLSDIPAKAKCCPNCGTKQGMPKWLIVLLIVIGCFVLLTVACSGGDEATSTGTTETEKEESKKVFKQNEIVKFEGVEYSIKSVKKSQGTEYDKPAEGKEYVIVTLLINNKSEEKITYNEFDWKMVNSDGQEDDSFGVTLEDTDTSLGSGDLLAGGKKEGTIVFEEPINDKGLKLNFYGNILEEEYSFQFELN